MRSRIARHGLIKAAIFATGLFTSWLIASIWFLAMWIGDRCGLPNSDSCPPFLNLWPYGLFAAWFGVLVFLVRAWRRSNRRG